MGGWTFEIKGMSDWGFGKEKGMFIWRRRRRHVWVGVALVLVIGEIEGGREGGRSDGFDREKRPTRKKLGF